MGHNIFFVFEQNNPELSWSRNHLSSPQEYRFPGGFWNSLCPSEWPEGTHPTVKLITVSLALYPMSRHSSAHRALRHLPAQQDFLCISGNGLRPILCTGVCRMPRKSDGKRNPEHCGLPAMPRRCHQGSGSPGQQRRLKRHCREMVAGQVNAAGAPGSRQEPSSPGGSTPSRDVLCSKLLLLDMGRSQGQR